MSNIFILYGIKDDQKFFIMNTNPIIWSSDIKQAKKYFAGYNAKYSIFRDYDNFNAVRNQLESGALDSIYLGLYDPDYNYMWEEKIL